MNQTTDLNVNDFSNVLEKVNKKLKTEDFRKTGVSVLYARYLKAESILRRSIENKSSNMESDLAEVLTPLFGILYHFRDISIKIPSTAFRSSATVAEVKGYNNANEISANPWRRH